MHISLYERPLFFLYEAVDNSFSLYDLWETSKRISHTLVKIKNSECFVVKHNTKEFDKLIAKSLLSTF